MHFHVKRTLRIFQAPEWQKRRKGYIYIGGHPQKQNFGNVVLANFEIYGKMFKEKNSSGYIIPDEIIKVLQMDMDERIYKN